MNDSRAKQRGHRSDYHHFAGITTRWADNDIYGHINNVAFYSFFDSCVNAFMIEHGGLDIHAGAVIALVVESGCRYHASASYPARLEAGLRVGHLGTSSLRWEVGIFLKGADEALAEGHFVHVFVDEATRRPVAIPDRLRKPMQGILSVP